MQALFALLSLADLLLTWLLLSRPGTAAYEANPVARWWLTQFGWSGLAAFKAATVLAVFAAAAALASRSHPRAAAGLLWFGCGVVAAVVLYSASLFPAAFAPGNVDEEVSRRAAWLAQARERVLRTQAEYDRLMADLIASLIAGRSTLAEAVEQLATSERANDPELQRGLAGVLPDRSPRERLAAVVWKHVVRARGEAPLPDDPVLSRLGQEYQATFGTDAPAA